VTGLARPLLNIVGAWRALDLPIAQPSEVVDGAVAVALDLLRQLGEHGVSAREALAITRHRLAGVDAPG
jgi:hypothetical protein